MTTATAEFRALPDIELSEESMHSSLPLGPDTLRHGKLANGMQYYVRPVKKPKERAALALAVRIGSVVESEEERGVAHIVEHLAFNATEEFENHAIIKFLESIGAEFGACSNAYTTADETVFELLVPTDDPKFLQDALRIFSQFATSIRCSEADLAKERGAVLDEWRMARNSTGRQQEAQWKLMLQGSPYAERLPIGLESVIRTVPAATVKAFYQRWYCPEHMCVVVVGDFPDPDAIVDLVRAHMEPCRPATEEGTPIPRFPLTAHQEPRYSSFADKEAQAALIYLTFKRPRRQLTTPAEYLSFLEEELFESCCNERLFKISRESDPPFYTGSVGREPLTATIDSFTVSAQAQEGRISQALEALLMEVARIRQHGFSEREVKIAAAKLMADIESAYLERDQVYSTDVREEYVRNFLHGEFVVGQEHEARLSKALLPRIGAAQLRKIADACRIDQSCVIKAIAHKKHLSEQELSEVVARVAAMEAAAEIQPWSQQEAPSCLMPELPPRGTIVSRRPLPELGATEMQLSNGMRVAFKCTDFLRDQVLMGGFAAGGLSEVPRKDFRSCSFSTVVAGELGMFGVPPEVLSDVLAGKRAEVKVSEGAYWRTFGGDQSPDDLETALQLVYRLFTTSVTADAAKLATCIRITRETVASQVRSPSFAWSQRVRHVNYGECYYFQPISVEDVDSLDAQLACEHFNQAFRNPAEFTVVLTGSMSEEVLLPLVEQYLAAIPASPLPAPLAQRNVTPLPFSFPAGPLEEDVKVPMIMAATQTQITFPVAIPRSVAGEEIWLSVAARLLEAKLLQLLRFKAGDVYSVQVGGFFGAEAPSREGDIRGDLAVSFSCDPASVHRLVQEALDEIQGMQEAGPSEEEVATVRTLLQRSFETQQHENSYWHDQLMGGYQSRRFQQLGDVDEVYKRFQASRQQVLASVAPASAQQALQRLLPYPARERYTAISLLPQPPLWQRALATFSALKEPSPRTLSVAAVAAAVAGVAIFAVARQWWKGSRH